MSTNSKKHPNERQSISGEMRRTAPLRRIAGQQINRFKYLYQLGPEPEVEPATGPDRPVQKIKKSFI